MRFCFSTLGFLPALALLSVSAAPRPAPKPHPNLAGVWVLSPEPIKASGPSQRSGPGGRPSPGAEGGGGFGEEFPRGGLGTGLRGLGELLRAKARLSITQSDTLITVSDDAGWIRELIPTKQRMREELGQGGPAEVLTYWKGDKLFAERYLDERGGTYQERYELTDKGKRLTVRVSFKAEGMLRAIEGTRIYERESGIGNRESSYGTNSEAIGSGVLTRNTGAS